MSAPLAYLNGNFVAATEAQIAVDDVGFTFGATVSERLRTFGGKLFLLDEHLARFARSLEIIELKLSLSIAALRSAAEELTRVNYSLLPAGSDLGLCLFATPGSASSENPTVCMHTNPLSFPHFVPLYDQRQTLVVANFRQPPSACWPSELKCRSRMHYFLGDRAAAKTNPHARALFLDLDGFVSEVSTANILIHREQEGLISPPLEKILPGISLAFVQRLAKRLKIPFCYRDITVAEVVQANEVMLCSTSPCLWAVSQVDENPIRDRSGTRVMAQLSEAWKKDVGLDFEVQARQMAGK